MAAHDAVEPSAPLGLRISGQPSTSHPQVAQAQVTTSVLEQRVAHLLACIQPNAPSELRRLTISSYICDLIKKWGQQQHRQIEAFMFGSVPLRTYLPDGDIDVSIFTRLSGPDDSLRDSWPNQLVRFLEREGSRRDAPFPIRNCQVIQAEVKLVKCVVANVVIDISFNALGGLCTVAFLEWVDRTLGRGHIFKRSIVLVKAWCYYESRLLGAHHSLISSYALEAMVLYVFNLHGAALNTPLQVLVCFLRVFAAFEWDKYCLSMLGPIPLSSFPHPFVEHGALPNGPQFLDPLALREAVGQYSVQPALAVAAMDALLSTNSPKPSTSDQQQSGAVALASKPNGETATGMPRIALHQKFLNIMDPLLPYNNLGRSVSRASFARIRKAFTYGAADLERILQLEPLAAAEGIDTYFKNAWRSPTRMAADNQIFQARLAMGGALFFHQQQQQQQQQQQAAIANGTFLAARHRPATNLGGGRLRRLKSTSLPDISSICDAASTSNFEDTPNASRGFERTGTHHSATSGTAAGAGAPSQQAGFDFSDRGGNPTGLQSWRSISQPVSPTLSPRATTFSRAALPSPISHTSALRPAVVTMALDAPAAVASANSFMPGEHMTPTNPPFALQSSLPGPRAIPPPFPPGSPSAPPSATAPPSMFTGSTPAAAPVQGAAFGIDIFSADLDALMLHLTFARACQPQEDEAERATAPVPPAEAPIPSTSVGGGETLPTPLSTFAVDEAVGRAVTLEGGGTAAGAPPPQPPQPTAPTAAAEEAMEPTASAVPKTVPTEAGSDDTTSLAAAMASLPSLRTAPVTAHTSPAHGINPSQEISGSIGRTEGTTDASASSSLTSTPNSAVLRHRPQQLPGRSSPANTRRQQLVAFHPSPKKRVAATPTASAPTDMPASLPPSAVWGKAKSAGSPAPSVPASPAPPLPAPPLAPVAGSPAASPGRASCSTEEGHAGEQSSGRGTWSSVAGRPPSRLGQPTRGSMETPRSFTAPVATQSATSSSAWSGGAPRGTAAGGRGKNSDASVSASSHGERGAVATASAPRAMGWAAIAAGAAPAQQPADKVVLPSSHSGASTPMAAASPKVGSWAAAAAASPRVQPARRERERQSGARTSGQSFDGNRGGTGSRQQAGDRQFNLADRDFPTLG